MLSTEDSFSIKWYNYIKHVKALILAVFRSIGSFIMQKKSKTVSYAPMSME